jgi:hypothetical protein
VMMTSSCVSGNKEGRGKEKSCMCVRVCTDWAS